MLRHSLVYLAARGAPALLNLAAIVVYTRLVPAGEYGRYVLVVSGVVLARTLLFQWLGMAAVRFLVRYRERRDEFLGTLVRLFLWVTAASAVLVLGGIWLLPETLPRELVLLGLLLLWADGWFTLNQQLANAEERPLRYGVQAVGRSAIALAVGTALVLAGSGASGLVIGVIAGATLPTLWGLSTWPSPGRGRSDRRIASEVLAYGLPLAGTLAFEFIVSSSDRLLLGALLDASAAGLYAVGYDLAMMPLTVLMMVLYLAGYPRIVRALEDEGPDAARRRLGSQFALLLAVALPAAAGLALLAGNVAQVFLDAAYRPAAARVLPWIAAAGLLASVKAYYADMSFKLGKRTTAQLGLVAVAASVNVGLNVWWIPRIGMMGAAYSTGVAFALGLALSWAVGRRIFPLPLPGAPVLKVALATAGMAAALLPVAGGRGLAALAGQITLGAAVYGLLVLVLDLEGARRELLARLRREPHGAHA